MRRAGIGVVGSVVEDTIDRPGEDTVRDMGGGYHSIIAMSVILPAEFEAVPIVNVGEDALARVRADLERLPRVSLDGIRGVPAINNKVPELIPPKAAPTAAAATSNAQIARQ